jgi:anti-sigma B factor antagonist
VEYSVETSESVKIVHLQGPVDVSQAVALRDVLGAQIDGPSARVLVDLSEVPLIDSSGIGVMVTAHRRADGAGAGFALAAPGPTVARVFSLTRTDKLLDLYDTVPEGVEALRGA